MSFQSPNRKEEVSSDKKFSLLNYMIFKEKNLKVTPALDRNNKLTKDSFKVLEVLGKGGFGRVMKVELKKNRKLYAMK